MIFRGYKIVYLCIITVPLVVAINKIDAPGANIVSISKIFFFQN